MEELLLGHYYHLELSLMKSSLGGFEWIVYDPRTLFMLPIVPLSSEIVLADSKRVSL